MCGMEQSFSCSKFHLNSNFISYRDMQRTLESCNEGSAGHSTPTLANLIHDSFLARLSNLCPCNLTRDAYEISSELARERA